MEEREGARQAGQGRGCERCAIKHTHTHTDTGKMPAHTLHQSGTRPRRGWGKRETDTGGAEQEGRGNRRKEGEDPFVCCVSCGNETVKRNGQKEKGKGGLQTGDGGGQRAESDSAHTRTYPSLPCVVRVRMMCVCVLLVVTEWVAGGVKFECTCTHTCSGGRGCMGGWGYSVKREEANGTRKRIWFRGVSGRHNVTNAKCARSLKTGAKGDTQKARECPFWGRLIDRGNRARKAEREHPQQAH